MSLLSDLLARVKHRGQKSDVPPMLREDILRSLQRQRARRRWLLISLFSLVIMVAGVALALWFGAVQGPQLLSSRVMVPSLPSAPQAAGTHDTPKSEPEQPGIVASEASDQSRSPAGAETEAVSPPVAIETPTTPAVSQPTPPGLPIPVPGSQPPGSMVPGQAPESASVAAGRTPANEGRTSSQRSAEPSRPKPEASGGEGDTVRTSSQGQVDTADGPGDGGGSRSDELVLRKRTSEFGTMDKDSRHGQGAREVRSDAAGSGPDRAVAPVKSPRWDRDVYLYQASSSEAAGDLKQALAGYQKVLTLEPKNYAIMNNIAGILLRQGDYDEAIRYAERSLAVKHNHVPALINLSIAYLQKGNRIEGESCLRRALAIEASNRLALRNLAILLEKQDSLGEAQAIYAKLAALRDIQGFLGMARIAEKENQKAEAVKAYQGLLQLDGVSPAERALAGDRITVLSQ
ncbi:MAG TPA: hypothetical protein DCE18_12545 [Syntrophobacteraceae bacterium]|nr:hypothetical protein [Syntrophobacteraceae bacterium]